jgi:squalene cyclase
MTDEGMGYLSGMRRLTKLVLKSNLITDAGLFKLRNNPELKIIELHNTSVTEGGMKRFSETTGIKVTAPA